MTAAAILDFLRSETCITFAHCEFSCGKQVHINRICGWQSGRVGSGRVRKAIRVGLGQNHVKHSKRRISQLINQSNE